ncbi:hypothetical protein FNV43_RR16604 [Rhamnella rubrinervis]|uniref:DUF7780 domain-containing protein n=1 Tax=Rhamnella rubrinervis TaxID=2594499 RepID=A0A8K0MDC9_9ROSA|nr:hypothetical protein FNV43_RR16604 [Rhamnella rubrinervis]
MGFSAKAKHNCESWGMDLLLVFFPADNNNNNNSAIVDKDKLFATSSASTASLPSSSSSPPSSSSSSSSYSLSKSSTTTATFRRSNSNMLLTRAQSTISICALLVFITLLLFTLSTFEPTTRVHPTTTSRRFLSQKPPTNYVINPDPKLKPKTNHDHGSLLSASSWYAKMWKRTTKLKKSDLPPTALQGMGTLYRRGTRAMSDLVVGHVPEDINEDELRLFMRALHRSGLTAKADIVFVSESSSRFGSVIQEENESFLKLIHHFKQLNRTSSNRRRVPGFDATQFLKVGKKEVGEPLWGKRIRSSYNNSDGGGQFAGKLTQLSYGSVVGFETSELDPENSLSGFLDHVPLSLRRWACYPMLLGRVRHNFKHVMMVDVKNLVVLGDPLSRVRNKSPESVLLFQKAETTSTSKHGKKNSDKTQSSHFPVNSAIVTGGTRGIRRLSNAMLTEIVRAAIKHKRKSAVTESDILNQLVGNEFIVKNINLMKSTESVPDPSSVAGLRATSDASLSLSEHTVIQRGNSNHDLNSIIMKQLCSSAVDSSVYRDC